MRKASLAKKLLFRMHRVLRAGAPFVKVYGPMRSGSNYFEKLCYENLHVRICAPEQFGWKHGPLAQSDSVASAVILRDPIRWIVSLHEWEVRHGRTDSDSIEEFMSSPLTHPALVDAFGAVTPREYLESFLTAVQRSQEGVYVACHEDVVEDPASAVRAFAEAAGLSMRKAFVPVDYRADWWSAPRTGLDAFASRSERLEEANRLREQLPYELYRRVTHETESDVRS